MAGLILAFSGFQCKFTQSYKFDPRLEARVLDVVGVSYGVENDFNQAIELASEILTNVKFTREKHLIDTLKTPRGENYVFGMDGTMNTDCMKKS